MLKKPWPARLNSADWRIAAWGFLTYSRLIVYQYERGITFNQTWRKLNYRQITPSDSPPGGNPPARTRNQIRPIKKEEDQNYSKPWQWLFWSYSGKKYGTADGFQNRRGRFGACITSDIAAKLNRIVIQELISAGLPVTFIPPSSIFIAKNGKPLKTFIEPILILLEKGIIPVLYGDVIWDTKKDLLFFPERPV